VELNLISTERNYKEHQLLKIKNYIQSVNDSIEDMEISTLISNYIKHYFETCEISDRQLERSMPGLNLLLKDKGIFQLSIETVSWGTYCKIMDWITKQRDKHESQIIGYARIHLCRIYHYILDYCKINTQSIIDLKNNRELIVSDERTISSKVHFIDNNISTHFPINSEIENMHYQEYIHKKGQKSFTIFNLNRTPEFIKELLKEYISYSCNGKSPQIAASSFQFFIYHFNNSLLSLPKQPSEITEFTFDTFKKQYRFFKKFKKLEQLKPSPPKEVIGFYVFLDNYCKRYSIHNNVLSNSDYNLVQFTNNLFDKYYSNGYQVIKRSKLMDTPKSDRWLVYNNENKAQQTNQVSIGINFTEIIDEDYRNDVKDYMWNHPNAFGSKKAHVLIEFLNIVHSYKKNIVSLKNHAQEADKYFISDNVLQHYRFVIALRINKDNGTLRSYFKIVRGYLKYHKEKYKMNRLSDLILMVKGVVNQGGNPITKTDFAIIAEKIKTKKSESSFNELCYIIFNLAVTTKLRLGDITNLEVNCVIEKDELKGTGKISFHKKLSSNEKVTEILPIEKIHLIERAKELTQEARETASYEIKNYIFLKKRRRNITIRFTFQFLNFFSKVLNELTGQLEGKYIPYNLRHTFIDTLFSEGIKENLDILTITHLTGNSAHTALKHYRKKMDIIRYAESFSGVMIADVNTNGEFIEDTKIEELNPVKEELGACKESSCIINTDGEYECLTCNFFATSLSRLTNFRNRIKKLKEQRVSVINPKQRELIDIELKLTTAYYAKILEMRGKE
jgi:integrase